MKKVLLLLAILALLIPVVGAQDDPAATEEADEMMMDYEAWTCPEGYEGQTLSIFNWSTYVAEDTIPNFEEACGVTVNYDIFESNEAMLARIRQGNPGYDIVVPSGATVEQMVAEELLIPINLEMIPNYENLLPNMVGLAFDPESGYSIPYQWGTIGVGYSTEAFPDGITSWEQVWDYDGNVAWLDDRASLIGVALTILGFDPNSTNPDEVTQARDYLIEKGSNVVTVAGDDGQVLLERGEVDIAIEYNGDISQIIADCECEDFAYVLPKEGSNVWVDNLAIPVDAPNPELAMVFMDYILDAKVGADLSNYIAYASPNAASIESGFLDEAMLTDPAIYPPEEQMENLFTSVYLGAEGEELYNNAWDELLIFLGQ